MAKYTPLQVYLDGLPDNMIEIRLRFRQIERILSDRLPASATRYSEWWSNEVQGDHVQARSWMDVGWVVDTVNLKSAWVRFKRL